MALGRRPRLIARLSRRSPRREGWRSAMRKRAQRRGSRRAAAGDRRGSNVAGRGRAALGAARERRSSRCAARAQARRDHLGAGRSVADAAAVEDILVARLGKPGDTPSGRPEYARARFAGIAALEPARRERGVRMLSRCSRPARFEGRRGTRGNRRRALLGRSVGRAPAHRPGGAAHSRPRRKRTRDDYDGEDAPSVEVRVRRVRLEHNR